MIPQNFHHRERMNHFWRETRIIYKKAPSTPAPSGGAGKWDKFTHYSGKIARGAWRPLSVPYYMMGGGIINFTAKNVYRALTGAGAGMRSAGEKVNETGHYLKGGGIEVAKGAWNTTLGPFLTFLSSIPRDIKMNLFDVPIESGKTLWEMLAAPFRAVGKNTRKRIGNLFKGPGEILNNLVHFRVREAVNSTLNLRPLQILKQTLFLDFKGAAKTTRSLVSDVFAPVDESISPIFKQGIKIPAKGIESKTQYWTSLTAAAEQFRHGIGQFMGAPAAGRAEALHYQAEMQALKAQAAALKAAAEGTTETAANGNQYAGKKAA